MTSAVDQQVPCGVCTPRKVVRSDGSVQVARTVEELANQLQKDLRGERDWHDEVVAAATKQPSQVPETTGETSWVRTEDRLPPVGELVLGELFFDGAYIVFLVTFCGDTGWYQTGKPRHCVVSPEYWCPIPKRERKAIGIL